MPIYLQVGTRRSLLFDRSRPSRSLVLQKSRNSDQDRQEEDERTEHRESTGTRQEIGMTQVGPMHTSVSGR